MGINTGLGWECDPRYLVSYEGELLGRIPDIVQWSKASNGIAINVFTACTAGDPYYGGGWHRGPLILSTNPDNISVDGRFNRNSGSFICACMTWYWQWVFITGTTWGPWGPKEYDPQGRPLYLQDFYNVFPNGIQIRDLIYILDLAKVKAFVSWKGISFAAGLATGLAARAWSYIGDIDMNLKSRFITSNGTYSASDEGVEGYSSVIVNVPNSYTAIDEDKVVSKGELKAQTAKTVTETGTYITTYNNSVIVDIPSASGEVF